ncbi:MAG: FUSC family protein [Deltaproteobacteria bacterium]|nr:FUSC family protein [Deltaproteobacteria bacterium]
MIATVREKLGADVQAFARLTSGFFLSPQFKEAFKTALAMVIAYAISLSMGWDKPLWAGFAVAFVSLATVGQSINKAAMRMVGTLMGMVVALSLIALFPQDRWAFIAILSIYTTFCAYMMSGSRNAYFWHVSAFVCVIICVNGGADAANAFQIAMLRTQQTGLGILVYSLVSIFLWPVSSYESFKAATGELAVTQLELYRACLRRLQQQTSKEDIMELSAREIQQKARFDQLLAAAETDSYVVHELSNQWRSYQQQVAKLMKTLAWWRESFAEVHSLDLPQLLPSLDKFAGEVERRLQLVADMLAGQPPESSPQNVQLQLERTTLSRLSHFERSALIVTRNRMAGLEELTRTLFEIVADITGNGPACEATKVPLVASSPLSLDLDRLGSLLRYVVVFWSVWLAYLYVQDLPGGSTLVIMASAIGIVVVNTPQLAVAKLILPLTNGLLFATVLYIFVMPTLSGFQSLGLLLFAATFVICYLYSEPRQQLGRLLGLAMLLSVTSINNQQSYHFLTVTTTAMIFAQLFLILLLTAHIPFSSHPERAVRRLVGRFFRSCDYLMGTMRWDRSHPEKRMHRWRQAFHAREVATLPTKVGSWLPFLDLHYLRGTTMDQVKMQLTSLQSLAYRIQLLREECQTKQADFLVQEFARDFRNWLTQVQSCFQQMAAAPDTLDGMKMRTLLDDKLLQLEERVQEALNKAPETVNREQDAINFYRLLGAIRSLSEALVDYVGKAAAIDWTPWQEDRF